MNRLPSPQISVHVSLDVEDPPDHVQPVSTDQVMLHPSPLFVLPSSHDVLREPYFFPSPQISIQTSFVAVVPPEHVQPVSIAHVELQPSPFTRLPSSQYVLMELNRFPSPQTSVQWSAIVDEPPVQVQPDSMLQVELHPSLLAVLPSSQYMLNVLNRLPSPHNSIQVSFVVEDPPEQLHVASTAQVELQPSPLTVLPSSQYVLSELNRLPSPHISFQISTVVNVPPEHVQPDSIDHVELQPSPFELFPSSQYVIIEFMRLPSPQVSFQISGAVDEPPDHVQPDSTAHIAFHPSPIAVLPSSQYVLILLYRRPSPHTSTHTSFVIVVPPDHVQPDSLAQAELHPSPFKLFPSSQYVAMLL